MDLKELKDRLSEISVNENELRNRFESELTALRDSERTYVENYLSDNAKYHTNEKVMRKADHSNRWIPCFIGWRDINRESWNVEYYTHPIKKDGSPSKLMSAYPCSEDCIKPYKLKVP